VTPAEEQKITEWEHFSRVKDTVKGDMIYIYGQSNDERVISKLEAVIKGQYNEEVREAAQEALQELSQQQRTHSP
jgi:hypothetical protein